MTIAHQPLFKLCYDEPYLQGTLIERNNRFLCHVLLDGSPVSCHVPNTSRLTELLVPGAPVGILKASNPNRKTAYDLVTVEYKGTTVNLDSNLPNRFTQLLIEHNYFPEFRELKLLKPESTYLDSRFDFYWERESFLAKKDPASEPVNGNSCLYQADTLTENKFAGYIEVKGVNYVENGIAQFPGAPTIRGVKHLHTLMDAYDQGFDAAVIFIIQRSDAHIFRPHETMDPLFAATLRQAAAHGIKLLTASMVVQGKCVTPTLEGPTIDLNPV
ncbi:MAG: DNA/RNA nuclease SfsA [Fastidiosipilaceae bacterium]|nr:DNA/RNA nuclease SfsA [Clostridiaceae bacterium]